MAQITLNSTGVASSGSLVLQSNGTTSALTIDTSQNVGLGVTPSSWTVFKAFEIGAAGTGLAGAAGQPVLFSNAYYNGGWRYAANGAAANYDQSSGAHRWFNATSGTAGNFITFTQAMTLDASGNLLVGGTSTSALDGVFGTVVGGSSKTSAGLALETSTSQWMTYTTDATQAMLFYDARQNLERARIDSSGTIVLPQPTGATTGPGVITDSANYTGIRLYGNSNGNLTLFANNNSSSFGNIIFQTNNGSLAERARITSSGQVFVGLTSSINGNCTYQQSTQCDGNQVQLLRNTSSSTPYIAYWDYSGVTPNNTGSYFLQCNDPIANRFQLRSNGGIANYSANNVNLSDRREKTNFAPAKNYLDVICAIPVQTFNYIDQNREEDDGLTLGVVAQDVQAVAPEFVMESNWGTQEEPKMRLSIYQTDLQYALMKCIQEQQAIIEQLQADVAALKG